MQSHFLNISKRDAGEGGYAALMATILTLAASLTIIGGLTFFSLQEARINRLFVKSVEARFISEGGMEDAVYRVVAGKQIDAEEILAVGAGTSTVTITVDGRNKIIRSEGREENLRQNLETKIDVSTSGANFVYGAQVGDGGIHMENNSTIQGSVYSNGPITGNNTPTITGDAFAASTSPITDLNIAGNAYAYRIEKSTVGAYASSTTKLKEVTVGKDAHANELKESTISRNAFYQIIDAATVVLGQKFPGTPAPETLPLLAMPIPDATLDQWEAEAAAGGVLSSPCPYQPANGAIIGPVKIACDLMIDGAKTVTLAGPVWVVGDIDLKNSAVLRLHASFGDRSSMIISDDPANRSTKSKVSVQNSAQIFGSGTAGSYVLVVSRNNSAETGGGNTAIEVKNSSFAPVYYAPHGTLSLENSTTLKEATAYRIEIKNSATLMYESGLADIKFSSGPAGGYDIKYWKAVE